MARPQPRSSPTCGHRRPRGRGTRRTPRRGVAALRLVAREVPAGPAVDEVESSTEVSSPTSGSAPVVGVVPRSARAAWRRRRTRRPSAPSAARRTDARRSGPAAERGTHQVEDDQAPGQDRRPQTPAGRRPRPGEPSVHAVEADASRERHHGRGTGQDAPAGTTGRSARQRTGGRAPDSRPPRTRPAGRPQVVEGQQPGVPQPALGGSTKDTAQSPPRSPGTPGPARRAAATTTITGERHEPPDVLRPRG